MLKIWFHHHGLAMRDCILVKMEECWRWLKGTCTEKMFCHWHVIDGHGRRTCWLGWIALTMSKFPLRKIIRNSRTLFTIGLWESMPHLLKSCFHFLIYLLQFDLVTGCYGINSTSNSVKASLTSQWSLIYNKP